VSVSRVRNLLLFLFSHRLLALARWDLHFLRIRIRNALTLQRRRLRRFVATRQRPVFLNLGSGPRGMDEPHWVNVDGFRDRHVHFELDFSRPLPFDDNSFDGVLSTSRLKTGWPSPARCAEFCGLGEPSGPWSPTPNL